MKKEIPKDTVISHYFKYDDNTFEEMSLPDGRVLLTIVHTWEDGEKMEYGFQYSDGITRKGLNPLHIVGIFKNKLKEVEKEAKLKEFLTQYRKSESECAAK